MHFAIYEKLILVGRTVGDGTTPQRPFFITPAMGPFSNVTV